MRTWLARLLMMILVPLALFSALESGLRLAGFGHPATFLIPDAEPGYYRTNPAFCSLFLPDSFDLRPLEFRVARRKPANTLRIVLLGESAAQGIPVPSFAFAPQLRAQLRARDPGKEIEILDTGIVAINSHVCYQIARELAGFEPDLFLVYMGNNEVVGPYGPGCAYLSDSPPLAVIRASVWVRSTRIGQLAAAVLSRVARHRRPAAEWGGMSMFVDHSVAGDDPRLAGVYAHFEANLRGIVQAAAGAGVPTVLCTVVANLKDCAPFLSLHRAGLTAAELAAWQAAFDAGSLAWRLGKVERARVQLAGAEAIDPQYADTAFMLGSLEERAGNIAPARRHFVAALHWDALRFRPDPRINEIIRQVAQGSGAGCSLVDTARLLGADPESTEPPAGRELLFEHVHFDWEGNYRVARAMEEGVEAAARRFQGEKSGEPPLPRPPLDSSACAAALGYTPHERLPMLLRIEVLVRKPPFTQQLTYVADEARLNREIAAATDAARAPAVLSQAESVATAALARDPDNPALAGILEGIELDRGNAEAALGLARRAQLHLPRDFALSADEASILLRMGRFDAAGAVLKPWRDAALDRDSLGPVFLQYWTQTKRFAEGQATLSAWIGQNPGDRRLRLLRGSLRQAGGDGAGAEQDYRQILSEDPANEEALEALVARLQHSGRGEEAGRVSLAAARNQPRNQNNDLRAAKVSEPAGDEPGAIRWLEAAERNGPVTSTFELSLALKFYRLKQTAPMMLHLAEAEGLSREEGNPAVTASIEQLIRRVTP